MEFILTITVMLVVGFTEWLHHQRVQRIGRLAFGPTAQPTIVGKAAPFMRVLGLGVLTWSLTILFTLPPKVHRSNIVEVPKDKKQHMVLVLDVSPSMRINDSGADGKESRLRRSAEIIKSLFARLNQDYLHLTIVATYNGAIPVVKDTRDFELIDSMLADLPMHFAFKTGKTKLFDGIQVAADLAEDWRDGSTTMILVSDGETVPATGMPKLPSSIADIIVIGVGDPVNGTFSNGQQSRQNVSELQQIANRLGGTYHDGNFKHVSTDSLSRLNSLSMDKPKEPLTRREIALVGSISSASVLAILPLVLFYLGSPFRPKRSSHNQPHSAS